MAIPISYNLRNLLSRRTTTIMTALGIGLTVAVLLSILAMVEGLRAALASTGHPLQILVLRKGAPSEGNSTIEPETFRIIKTRPGIATDASGEPVVSLELVTVILLEGPDLPAGANITVRGLTTSGLSLRGSELRIVRGSWHSAN